MTTFLEPHDYEEYLHPTERAPVHLFADSSCREDEDAIDREQTYRQSPGKRLRYYVNRSSLTDQAEDVVMRDEFGHDQNKSDNSEGDLHSLSPEAPAGNRRLPPLRSGPFPE
jgi:hypothetical protein